MEVRGHWIAGRHVNPPDEPTADIYDPATGTVQRQVALATPATVDAAVTAARHAWLSRWRTSSLSERTRVLFAFRELVAANRDELATAIVSEHGKVHADAVGEVQRGLEVVEFACGIAHLSRGDFTGQVSTGVDTTSMRQSVGVAVGITPFNFPAMVPMWMFPLAIACGNTFVLKPSERDPSVSLMLAELWQQAGLPDGVFNVVQGDRGTVDALLAHPGVDAVSFVGSTPVARHVMTTATANGKRVQALGGAKNHMVVMPDADLDLAADAAVSAAFGSAGERCMAISVVVAVGPIADPLVEAITQRAQRLTIAPGTVPDADMGPLITREHRDRVTSYLDRSAQQGATIVADGRTVDVSGVPDGFWLGPCVVDHVTPAMDVYRDEVFGPVLSVVRGDDLDAAIALINANPYGNGTAIFTGSGAAARRFEFEIDVGMVGVNVPIPVPMAYHAFGGWKQSLFGDTHIHGMDGVRFYTRGKVVTSRWPATVGPEAGDGVRLAFPTAT